MWGGTHKLQTVMPEGRLGRQTSPRRRLSGGHLEEQLALALQKLILRGVMQIGTKTGPETASAIGGTDLSRREVIGRRLCHTDVWPKRKVNAACLISTGQTKVGGGSAQDRQMSASMLILLARGGGVGNHLSGTRLGLS